MRLRTPLMAFAIAAIAATARAAWALEGPELPPAAQEPAQGAVMPPAGIDRPAPSVPPAAPTESAALPAIERDVSKLPVPVRRLREQIIAAAETGDPEAFRAIFDANGPVEFGTDAEDADPVAQLRALSGDPEGREILAVLIEVLEAGYVHVDAGTDEELYLWPYFARYPVDALTPPQLVELFKLVLAGDYEDMKAYGFYTWFRVGISPDGTWQMFSTD